MVISKWLRKNAMNKAHAILGLVLAIALPTLSHISLATTAPAQTSYTLSTSELRNAIKDGLTKVDEFAFLKKEAEKLGVKVYLFGGTAAAFAHYVKWDFLQKKGDPRFFPDRFDFRYINIYRSTQDMDIVVDGPGAAINQLASLLTQNFPYLQGSKQSKDSWEVRSLRENFGGKIALLNNSDFLNQHTDSNSVGLIEITTPDTPEHLVRDLRDWDNLGQNNFLMDIIEGRLHYYFSPNHHETQYFQQGRNPPIVSVIRYLIKASQFELKLWDEDLKIIQKLIAEFDPASVKGNSYLETWFQNNVPKLIQNSIDVEYTMKLLTRVGLGEKLLQIGNIQQQDSVAWWMNRSPLPSLPLGTKGATAASLGIDVVAHETTSFLIFESITRSHQGVPNVLESRKGVPGESAALGDGFYTRKGRNSGFRGTGFTIRFQVNPNARQGVDFDTDSEGDYIVFHNRNALTVIPESLNLDLIGYFSLLSGDQAISRHDLGILHRLRLGLRAHLVEPTAEETAYLKGLPQSDLLNLLTKETDADTFLLLLRFLDYTKIHSKAYWDLLEKRKTLISKAARTSDSEQTKIDNFQKASRNLLTPYFWLTEPTFSEITDAMKGDLFKDSEQLNTLAKSIVAKGLTLEQLIQHAGIGVFKSSDELYWETALAKIKSIDDYLPTYRAWLAFTQEEHPNSHLKKLLARGWKLFYSLRPNEEHIKEFNRITKRPATYAALATLHEEDPVVFALSLGMALSRDKDARPMVLKLWQKKRDQFFAANPESVELIDASKFLIDPEIQVDLLKYANEKKVFRRRTDMVAMIETLAKQDPTQFQKTQAFQKELKLFIQLYLEKQPSPNETQALVNKLPFSTSDIIDLLQVSNTLEIRSKYALVSILSKMKEPLNRNYFMLQNINNFPWLFEDPEGVQQVLNQLNFGEASLPLLEAFKKHNQRKPKLITDLLVLIAKTHGTAFSDFYSSTLNESIEIQFANSGEKLDFNWIYYFPDLPSIRQFLKFASTKVPLKWFGELANLYKAGFKVPITDENYQALIAYRDSFIEELFEQAFSKGTQLTLSNFGQLTYFLTDQKIYFRILDRFIKEVEPTTKARNNVDWLMPLRPSWNNVNIDFSKFYPEFTLYVVLHIRELLPLIRLDLLRPNDSLHNYMIWHANSINDKALALEAFKTILMQRLIESAVYDSDSKTVEEQLASWQHILNRAHQSKDGLSTADTLDALQRIISEERSAYQPKRGKFKSFFLGDELKEERANSSPLVAQIVARLESDTEVSVNKIEALIKTQPQLLHHFDYLKATPTGRTCEDALAPH